MPCHQRPLFSYSHKTCPPNRSLRLSRIPNPSPWYCSAASPTKQRSWIYRSKRITQPHVIQLLTDGSVPTSRLSLWYPLWRHNKPGSARAQQKTVLTIANQIGAVSPKYPHNCKCHATQCSHKARRKQGNACPTLQARTTKHSMLESTGSQEHQ